MIIQLSDLYFEFNRNIKHLFIELLRIELGKHRFSLFNISIEKDYWDDMYWNVFYLEIFGVTLINYEQNFTYDGKKYKEEV